jgi:hypothetical protein
MCLQRTALSQTVALECLDRVRDSVALRLLLPHETKKQDGEKEEQDKRSARRAHV